VTSGPAPQVECDVLILSAFEGGEELPPPAAAVDQATGGGLSALMSREKFEGKASQIAEFTPGDAVAAHKVFVIGLGKQDECDLDTVLKATAAAIKKAAGISAGKVAIAPACSFGGKCGCGPMAEAIVSVSLLAGYKFVAHKTEDPKPNSIETIELLAACKASEADMLAGIDRGKVMAEAVCFARDLTNTPANIATPEYLADQARRIADDTGLSTTILGPAEMAEMDMNLVLAVACGSDREPRFIALKYEAAGAAKTVAIVGKGLTFDAGGLCLKPGRYMDSMKTDMAGAGSVLAAIKAIAALKPDVNVLCLIPATENMPGGNALKPGDIVKAFSGKSVEINDTDAEGRLILADAVAYAEREKVDEIIDIATLTGACEVALGKNVAGLMATDQGMIEKLIAAGKAGGEKLWQLPLEPEYEETLSSDIADMKNYAPEAGAITAAQFIKKHINGTAWAHIDIAGPSYGESPYMSAKGATGFGVYTLVNYITNGA